MERFALVSYLLPLLWWMKDEMMKSIWLLLRIEIIHGVNPTQGRWELRHFNGKRTCAVSFSSEVNLIGCLPWGSGAYFKDIFCLLVFLVLIVITKYWQVQNLFPCNFIVHPHNMDAICVFFFKSRHWAKNIN